MRYRRYRRRRYSRRRWGAKRRRVSRRGLRGGFGPRGGTARVANGSNRDSAITVQRTFYTAGTQAGPIADYFGYSRFDPSGSLALRTLFGNTTTQIPGWSQFSGIYEQFKLHWVRMHFRLRYLDSPDTTGYQPSAINARLRYNYDIETLQDGKVGYDDFSYAADVVNWTFTPEHPNFSYKVYPRVLKGTLATTTTLGYTVTKPGWSDVDDPPIHLGCMLWVDNIPDGWQLIVDLEQRVSFRYIRDPPT